MPQAPRCIPITGHYTPSRSPGLWGSRVRKPALMSGAPLSALAPDSSRVDLPLGTVISQTLTRLLIGTRMKHPVRDKQCSLHAVGVRAFFPSTFSLHEQSQLVCQTKCRHKESISVQVALACALEISTRGTPNRSRFFTSHHGR